MILIVVQNVSPAMSGKAALHQDQIGLYACDDCHRFFFKQKTAYEIEGRRQFGPQNDPVGRIPVND